MLQHIANRTPGILSRLRGKKLSVRVAVFIGYAIACHFFFAGLLPVLSGLSLQGDPVAYQLALRPYSVASTAAIVGGFIVLFIGRKSPADEPGRDDRD